MVDGGGTFKTTTGANGVNGVDGAAAVTVVIVAVGAVASKGGRVGVVMASGGINRFVNTTVRTRLFG